MAEVHAGAEIGALSYQCVKRILPPSRINRAVAVQFRQGSDLNDTEEHVVLVKHNLIEVHKRLEDGTLVHVCERNVYGVVHDIAVWRWQPDGRRSMVGHPSTDGADLLLVISDSPYLAVLALQPRGSVKVQPHTMDERADGNGPEVHALTTLHLHALAEEGEGPSGFGGLNFAKSDMNRFVDADSTYCVTLVPP